MRNIDDLPTEKIEEIFGKYPHLAVQENPENDRHSPPESLKPLPTLSLQASGDSYGNTIIRDNRGDIKTRIMQTIKRVIPPAR
ncbi:hypothetical protein K9M41_02310 [Candidatus Gracilibacteria bacterium]|nr:hypothetical protein [Candidatus Gracilibacteria bacterium]